MIERIAFVLSKTKVPHSVDDTGYVLYGKKYTIYKLKSKSLKIEVRCPDARAYRLESNSLTAVCDLLDTSLWNASIPSVEAHGLEYSYDAITLPSVTSLAVEQELISNHFTVDETAFPKEVYEYVTPEMMSERKDVLDHVVSIVKDMTIKGINEQFLKANGVSWK